MNNHLSISPQRFRWMKINISRLTPFSISSKDEINMFSYETENLKSDYYEEML